MDYYGSCMVMLRFKSQTASRVICKLLPRNYRTQSVYCKNGRKYCVETDLFWGSIFQVLVESSLTLPERDSVPQAVSTSLLKSDIRPEDLREEDIREFFQNGCGCMESVIKNSSCTSEH